MKYTYDVWVGETRALEDCTDVDYAVAFAEGIAYMLKEQRRKDEVWVRMVMWYTHEEGGALRAVGGRAAQHRDGIRRSFPVWWLRCGRWAAAR